MDVAIKKDMIIDNLMKLIDRKNSFTRPKVRDKGVVVVLKTRNWWDGNPKKINCCGTLQSMLH